MAVLWSLTCAAVKLSLSQDNDLPYSIPDRIQCPTEATNNLLRSLETCKMLKVIIKLKSIKNI